MVPRVDGRYRRGVWGGVLAIFVILFLLFFFNIVRMPTVCHIRFATVMKEVE